MKKRTEEIIKACVSMLLILCLLSGMLSDAAITASAEADTQSEESVRENTDDAETDEDEETSSAEDVSGEAGEETASEADLNTEESDASGDEADDDVDEEIEAEGAEESADAEPENPYANYEASDQAKEAAAAQDFSSLELLIKGNATEEDSVIGSYDDICLLSFDSAEETQEAFAYYYDHAQIVEVNDAVYTVSDADAEESGDAAENRITNALEILSETEIEEVSASGQVIALIDTGVSSDCGITDAVSVIGSDPYDDNGHGTAMYQTICSYNGNAQILSIKAFSSDGTADSASVYAGIRYAIEAGADIINLSFSAAYTEENGIVAGIIQEAIDADITVVGAAGNSGIDASETIPGGIEGAYIFGSVTEDRIIVSASNYGETVDGYMISLSTSYAAAAASAYFSLGYTLKEMFDEEIAYADYAQRKSSGEDQQADEQGGTFTVALSYSLSDLTAISSAGTHYIKSVSSGDSEYNSGISYVTSDGAIAYCGNRAASGPGSIDGGNEYASYDKAYIAPTVVSYILANGYPTTRTINGTKFSKSDAWGITQAALWLYTNPEYDVDSNSMSGISDTHAAAAEALYADAVSYAEAVNAGSTDDEYYGYAIIVANSNYSISAAQPMIIVNDAQEYVRFRICKESGNDYTDGNEAYSVEGAVYGVYSTKSAAKADEDGTAALCTLTVGSDGYSGYTSKLDFSTYYIKELNAPENYELDTTVYQVKLKSDKSASETTADDLEYLGRYGSSDDTYAYVVTVSDTAQYGRLDIYKESANAELTDSKSYYNLSGAVYTVYTDSSCKTIAYKTNGDEAYLTVLSSGNANAIRLPVGEYYVKETTTPKGYLPDETVYYVQIEAGEKTWVGAQGGEPDVDATVYEEFETGYLDLKKQCTQGDFSDTYSLSGAVYSVYTNAACTKAALDVNGEKAVFTTDADGNADRIELAYGKYYVRETTAPESFTLDETVYTVTVSEYHETVYVDDDGDGFVAEIPQSGELDLHKDSADEDITDGNSLYSLEGVTYTVYTDAACSKKASDVNGETAQFILNENGDADSITLYIGTYYVLETAAGTGYWEDDTVYTVIVDADDTVWVNNGTVSDVPMTGTIALHKKSADETTTAGNPNYSLAGFLFTAVNTQTGTSYSAVTDEDGEAAFEDLPLGIYTVTEDSAQTNLTYMVNDTAQTVSITAENAKAGITVYDISFEEEITTGILELYKSSADETITGEGTSSDGTNAMYSLEGLTFTAELTGTESTYQGQTTWTLTTDADGYARLEGLPLGTYTITEDSPDVQTNQSYAVSDETGTVTISPDASNGPSYTGTYEVSFSDMPTVAVMDLILIKAGAESQDADLSGAVYRISYYDSPDAGTEAVRTWYFETDSEGKIYLDPSCTADGYESDDLYCDSSGETVLPLGSITVQEIEGPAGFILDETVYTAAVTAVSSGSAQVIWEDDQTGTLAAENTAEQSYAVHYESPVRDELELVKLDADGEGMEYIPFLITRTWTDADGSEQSESQIIVTDQYGVFDSSQRAKTLENVNVLDPAVYVSGSTFIVPDGCDESDILTAAAAYNIWFGSLLDLADYISGGDVPGSLLTGTYTVTELSCSANAGKTSLIQKTFTVTNTYQTDTADHATGDRKTKVRSEDGSVMEYSGTETHSVCVVDLEIEISTDAAFSLTGGKVVFIGDSVTVQDVVSIDNLSSLQKYKVFVDFVDADGNSLLTDASAGWSDEIYAETTGISEEITIEADIDTSSFSDGGNVYAVVYLYEYLESADDLIGGWYLTAAHNTDLTDEKEQLILPQVTTEAADTWTADHVGTAAERASVVDTVSYEHLESGCSYKVTADLVDGNGTVYASESKYIHVGTDTDTITNLLFGFYKTTDSVEMELSVDTSTLGGITLYVNETIEWVTTQEGEETLYTVIFHDSGSAKEQDQAVHYVHTDTGASDGLTGDHVGVVTEEGETTSITDVVTLENLIPGMTYTISGILLDQESGTAVCVNGNTITQEIVLTVSEDGTQIITDNGCYTEVISYDRNEYCVDAAAEVTFTFDSSSLGGKTLVVSETVYHNGTDVSRHTNLSDVDQTIFFPAITTSASDGKTADDVGTVEEDAVIIDTVTVENLIPGLTYVIKGTLMNRQSAEAVLTDEQAVEQTAYITVSEDGSSAEVTGGSNAAVISFDEDYGSADVQVDLIYSLDSSLLSGTTVVVYETLYHNEIDTARHKDLNDNYQSVYYPEISTSAADTLTEDHVAAVRTQAQITDTVTVKNLVPGRTYLIYGILMNQKSGEEVTVNDEKITQTVTITVSEDGSTITASNGEITSVTQYDETLNSVSGTVDLTFDFDASALGGQTLVVYETLYHPAGGSGETNIALTSHEEQYDAGQTVHFPDIGTSASDADTGDMVGTSEDEAKIIDMVTLENLLPGMTYTVSGILMDQETGEALLIDGQSITQTAVITVSEDGTRITAQNGEETSVSSEYDSDENSVDGTVALTFVFSAADLSGSSVVVYETLYHNDIDVACHRDLTDQGQTIHYPQVHTTAADAATADAVGTVSGEAVILDTVMLENLVPGEAYRVCGVLMSQQDGTPLTDADGNEIAQTVTVIAAEDGTAVTVSNGDTAQIISYDAAHNSVDVQVILTFALDASLLEGTSAVVFETLFHDDTDVARHCDPEDEGQTVNYPKVRTAASDSETGDHVGSIRGALINGIKHLLGDTDADGNEISDDLQQNIIDTVTLTNLTEGKTYTLSGVLMDANAGSALLIGGEEVTATAAFTVTDGTFVILNGNGENVQITEQNGNQVSGTIDLVFSFDSSLKDDTAADIVVFEELYHENASSGVSVLVASHTDYDDADQSIGNAGMETTALDETSGGHIGCALTATAITDEVNLSGLVAGEEYTVEGILVDMELSSADTLVFLYDAQGNPVTAQQTFTASAQASSGDAQSAFTVSETIHLSFDLSNADVEGKTIAAVELLYHNDILLTEHALGYDEEGNLYAEASQMVKYPKIETNAQTGDLDEADLYNEDGTYAVITITDTVSYSDLWTVSELEAMRQEGLLLYPDAFTQDTGQDSEEDVLWLVTGVLMIKETGEPLQDSCGNAVTASAVFTAEQSDGQTEVIFELDLNDFLNDDGSCMLEGVTLVAYEQLYFGTSEDEGMLCAVHEEIDDTAQDIRFPAGRTHAVSFSGADAAYDCSADASVHEHTAYGSETVQILDEVTYTNLHGGTQYTISGTLMDQETGEVFTDADGNAVISSTVTDANGNILSADGTFVTEGEYDDEVSGSVYVLFEFSGEDLSGRSIVVFETISRLGQSVITHADLSDASQTVHFITESVAVLTDDNILTVLISLLILISAVTAAAAILAIFFQNTRRIRSGSIKQKRL